MSLLSYNIFYCIWTLGHIEARGVRSRPPSDHFNQPLFIPSWVMFISRAICRAQFYCCQYKYWVVNSNNEEKWLFSFDIDKSSYRSDALLFWGGNQNFWSVLLEVHGKPAMLEGLLQIEVTDRHTFWISSGFHYLTQPQTYNPIYLVLAYMAYVSLSTRRDISLPDKRGGHWRSSQYMANGRLWTPDSIHGTRIILASN